MEHLLTTILTDLLTKCERSNYSPLMKICSHIRGECISSSGCALYVRVQGAVPEWGKSMMVELTMEKTLLCEGNATFGVWARMDRFKMSWDVMLRLS